LCFEAPTECRSQHRNEESAILRPPKSRPNPLDIRRCRRFRSSLLDLRSYSAGPFLCLQEEREKWDPDGRADITLSLKSENQDGCRHEEADEQKQHGLIPYFRSGVPALGVKAAASSLASVIFPLILFAVSSTSVANASISVGSLSTASTRIH